MVCAKSVTCGYNDSLIITFHYGENKTKLCDDSDKNYKYLCVFINDVKIAFYD